MPNLIPKLTSLLRHKILYFVLPNTFRERKVEREEITVLYLASKKGRSLRTTVPISIVKHLKLREKDKLKWELKPRENDFLIIVEPLEKRYRKKER